jgi:Ca-activated chloride channel family protein
VVVAALVTLQGQDDQFRFKSGVELINVTATVSDANGRFVSGLTKDDFVVFEDSERQTVTHFSAERVPVSLGVVLDTSGSMAGDKIHQAQSALDRFLFDLLDAEDEVFLYRFSDHPTLLQNWTTDRMLVSRAIARIAPSGGTAMYDAIAEAIPLAAQGQHVKKALVVISDGNDTSSLIGVSQVKRQIRESEVLVYAIGIDGDDMPTFQRQQPPIRRPMPFPMPFPPGGGRRPGRMPFFAAQGGWQRGRIVNDRVNVGALRDITDDTGGRTEIIHDPGDLTPATNSIADELSKQYYLGYASSGKRDGRWHSIRVEVRGKSYTVRARKGFVAS